MSACTVRMCFLQGSAVSYGIATAAGGDITAPDSPPRCGPAAGNRQVSGIVAVREVFRVAISGQESLCRHARERLCEPVWGVLSVAGTGVAVADGWFQVKESRCPWLGFWCGFCGSSAGIRSGSGWCARERPRERARARGSARYSDLITPPNVFGSFSDCFFNSPCYLPYPNGPPPLLLYLPHSTSLTMTLAGADNGLGWHGLPVTARSAQPSQGKRSAGAGRMDAPGMGQGWQARTVAPETRKRASGRRNDWSVARQSESGIVEQGRDAAQQRRDAQACLLSPLTPTESRTKAGTPRSRAGMRKRARCHCSPGETTHRREGHRRQPGMASVPSQVRRRLGPWMAPRRRAWGVLR